MAYYLKEHLEEQEPRVALIALSTCLASLRLTNTGQDLCVGGTDIQNVNPFNIQAPSPTFTLAFVSATESFGPDGMIRGLTRTMKN